MEQTTTATRPESRPPTATHRARRARARAHPRRRRRPARPARHPRPLRRRPSEAVLRARGPRAAPRPGAAPRVARRAALADDACPHAETRAVLPWPRLRHSRVLARDPALQPRHGGRCPLRATAHRPPDAERPRRHPAVGPLGLRRGRLHGARGGRDRHRAGASSAIVLLGVAPTRPEREYGWIEPSAPIEEVWSDLHGVARFVEKPDPARALDLQQSGTSYWNTSVVAGQAEALLFLFAMAQPELLDAFLQAWPQLGTPSEAAAMERLYEKIPASDFSRDILAPHPGSLSVLGVSGVAWEDIGNPDRLLAAQRRAPRRAYRPPSSAAS